MDSDEEAESNIARIRAEVTAKQSRIADKQQVISANQASRTNLVQRNETLRYNEQNKKQDTQDTLQRMDSNYRKLGSITITCQQCHKNVRCTPAMLQELLEKYDSGYQDKSYISFRYFMFKRWSWDHKTHVYNREFNSCFECLNQEDINNIEKAINENKDSIIALERSIAVDGALLGHLAQEKRKDEENLRAYQNQAAKRQQERAEKEQERAEKEQTQIREQQERAEKEQAHARIAELEAQLAIRSDTPRQNPLTRLVEDVNYLAREGGEFEVNMHTDRLTQEGRAFVAERLQAPANEAGIHSFRLTANREAREHQITNTVQMPGLVAVHQNDREQHRRNNQKVQQGILEEKHAIVRNLLADGNCSIELISGATGLSQEEVEAIQQDMTTSAEEVGTVQQEETTDEEDGVMIIPSMTEEEIEALEEALRMSHLR
ncbi:MAG: hypothetical protein ACX93T_03385 [Bacteroidota bacterium]